MFAAAKINLKFMGFSIIRRPMIALLKRKNKICILYQDVLKKKKMAILS